MLSQVLEQLVKTITRVKKYITTDLTNYRNTL